MEKLEVDSLLWNNGLDIVPDYPTLSDPLLLFIYGAQGID